MRLELRRLEMGLVDDLPVTVVKDYPIFRIGKRCERRGIDICFDALIGNVGGECVPFAAALGPSWGAHNILDMRLRNSDGDIVGLVCRRLGNIGYALYASRQYLATHGTPERGEGLGGDDLISYMGAPVWFGPLYMGESIEGARISMRASTLLSD